MYDQNLRNRIYRILDDELSGSSSIGGYSRFAPRFSYQLDGGTWRCDKKRHSEAAKLGWRRRRKKGGVGYRERRPSEWNIFLKEYAQKNPDIPFKLMSKMASEEYRAL